MASILGPPQGLVLFRGPSLLDGQPIVAIATGLLRPCENMATGPMIQTWIMREDIDPVTAAQTGQDVSICGDCPLKSNGCYVVLHQAPLQIWRNDQAGHYPTLLKRYECLFRSKEVRVGSYGDPAAVPTRRWKRVLRLTSGHTGYTHQWRTCDQTLRQWLMASVETPEQVQEARALGWRTFRIRLPEEPLLPGEFVCPKSDEYEATHGHRLTCVQCQACKGGEWTGQATPAIIVHGSAARKSQYRRIMLPLTS